MYEVSTYFNAKTLTELPLTTLPPLLNALITYWGIGLSNTAEQFFTYYFILWALIQASISLGYLISSSFEDFSIAQMIAPILMMPFMLFAGFYTNLNSQPEWLIWIKWIDPLAYSVEAMIQNEYNAAAPEGYDIKEALGFSFGCWKSIGILVAIAIACRIWAIIMLKSLVRKF